MRRALVVGAAQGIGRAAAEHLHRDGFRVTGTWHRTSPEPTDGIEWVRCDITEPDDVTNLFAAAADDPYDVLVANAALVQDRMTSRMSDEDFQSVLDVNLTGTFRAVRGAYDSMARRRWGRIVIISSVGGWHGNQGQTNYAASKAGQLGMAASLARELGPREVTVNVVAPGTVDTELIRSMSPRLRARWVEMTPIKRWAEPAEITAVISFLVSDAAAAVTGALIPVDAGWMS